MTTMTEGDDLVGEQPDDEEDVLGQINDRLKAISRKMDRKFLRNATVMVAFILIAVLAVRVAQSSSHDAHRAERRAARAEGALAAYKAATLEARVGSCEQFNQHEKDQAEIEVGESHDQIGLFVAAAPAGTDPAQVQRFVADYNRRHDGKIRAVHQAALRDCSPAGIAAFLRGTK